MQNYNQPPMKITNADSDAQRVCSDCGRGYRFNTLLNPAATRNHCADCARRHRLWAEICPPLYRDTDPARLPQNSLNNVLAWQYGVRGLVLHGPTGKGKTRAAFLLLHRLYWQERKIIVAFDATGFSHGVAKQFGPDGNSERWLQKVKVADVVFFDDLGKGKLTERGEAELFGIFEARTANRKPIIVTANSVGDSLAASLRPDTGPPLVRRLREFCECVAF